MDGAVPVQLREHSKYLVFRFTLDTDGNVELHYKRFSDMEWEPSGEGVHVIVVRFCFKNMQILRLYVNTVILNMYTQTYLPKILSHRSYGKQYTHLHYAGLSRC